MTAIGANVTQIIAVALAVISWLAATVVPGVLLYAERGLREETQAVYDESRVAGLGIPACSCRTPTTTRSSPPTGALRWLPTRSGRCPGSVMDSVLEPVCFRAPGLPTSRGFQTR